MSSFRFSFSVQTQAPAYAQVPRSDRRQSDSKSFQGATISYDFLFQASRQAVFNYKVHFKRLGGFG